MSSRPDPSPKRPAGLALTSERVLQQRWALAPPAWLCAADGRPLRVLFAGTWNHGPGPDFRGALLLPERGPPLRGDVEIHRRPQDWRGHGHHADPAYDGVLLHLHAPLSPPPAGRARGAVAGPARRAALAPRAPAVPPPPCRGIVGRAGAPAVRARLRRLARERLRAKVVRLRARLVQAEPDVVAARALLEALAQGGNERPMAHLCGRLAWSALVRAAAAGDAALLARLLREAGAGAPPPGRPGRPANRLRRRLRAAALLMARLAGGGDGSLAGGLAGLASLPPPAAAERLRLPGLLGPVRARQLLVDVAYPLALALPGAAPGEEALLRWLDLPGARYARTAVLRARLEAPPAVGAGLRVDGLRAGGLRPLRNAETQALLDLERCYCRFGSCAVCPLARLAPPPRTGGPRPSPNAMP